MNADAIQVDEEIPKDAMWFAKHEHERDVLFLEIRDARRARQPVRAEALAKYEEVNALIAKEMEIARRVGERHAAECNAAKAAMRREQGDRSLRR